MIQWNILDWCNHFGEFFFIKQYLLNAFYVPGKLLGMGDIDIDEAYDYIHEINSYVDGNKWGTIEERSGETQEVLGIWN